MAENGTSEALVPVTFKLPKTWAAQMEVIRLERGHRKVSVTYREAVAMYMAEYHRGKAA